MIGKVREQPQEHKDGCQLPTVILPLEHYVHQAHKGTGVGKVHPHKQRLYRSFRTHGPRGFHDFQNLGWDPSVYRGSTFKDFREKNLPSKMSTVNTKYYCSNRPPVAPQSSLRKRRNLSRFQKVGGIIRPSTEDIMEERMAGRKTQERSNDWGEFLIEQFEVPLYKNSFSQPDEISDASLSMIGLGPPRSCIPLARGPSTSAQANIPYIGTAEADDPIRALVEQTGHKILEQSLLEATEDYELYELRRRMNSVMEAFLKRQLATERLIEREQFKVERRATEKITTEKNLRFEVEAEERLSATLFATQLAKRIVHVSLGQLKQLNFFKPIGKELDNYFEEWFNHQMVRSIYVPRMLIDDIIEKVQIAIETTAALSSADLREEVLESPPKTPDPITPAIMPDTKMSKKKLHFSYSKKYSLAAISEDTSRRSSGSKKQSSGV